MTPPSTFVPTTVIRPRRGWRTAIDLPELWGFRELLFALAARDLRLRYKQTALGIIWVVLQPLLAAGVLSVVFGKVAKLSTDGAPPYLFAFAGMLGWNIFSGILTRAGQSLVGNSHLISKVFFPRIILPLSTVPSVLVDCAVSLVMIAIMMTFSGTAPRWGAILLLPVAMVILILLAVGGGLICGALAVQYRDVQYIIPVAMQILLLASPIAYSLSAVPEGNLRTLLRLNPLCAPLEAFQAS
ncbi:MAG TPA: ABC transporter permease, partial [Tepidisphaeraceae bacterium]